MRAALLLLELHISLLLFCQTSSLHFRRGTRRTQRADNSIDEIEYNRDNLARTTRRSLLGYC
jgi:hypothetical protein